MYQNILERRINLATTWYNSWVFDNYSFKKLQSVNLNPSTPLRMLVWRLRQFVRDRLGKDILNHSEGERHKTTKARDIYLKVDDFIKRKLPGIEKELSPIIACRRVSDTLSRELGYEFSDVDEKRPWGAYYRIVDEQADRFLEEFFPGLSPNEARLGRDDVILSPKIMLVFPGRRLSWQYHDRRSERWRFMTDGHYYRSHSDKPGKLITSRAGDIVQFSVGERHRLCANEGSYTIVAEIWQHTEHDHPSTEKDIVRLADDYKRK